jgi:GH15 family glucan-1,4-alpha-glucosidase
MPSRIEHYALIGDCETAALVFKDGSIDWLCWPCFDSEACFWTLLGDASNGRWKIAPAAVGTDIKVSRRYQHNTLILETEFTSADATVVLIDFMPLREGRNSSHLVRLMVGKRGSMADAHRVDRPLRIRRLGAVGIAQRDRRSRGDCRPGYGVVAHAGGVAR